jgi:hypothetical protein
MYRAKLTSHSHDALGKELQLLIKNLKPGTKEIKKADAMWKISIYG